MSNRTSAERQLMIAFNHFKQAARNLETAHKAMQNITPEETPERYHGQYATTYNLAKHASRWAKKLLQTSRPKPAQLNLPSPEPPLGNWEHHRIVIAGDEYYERSGSRGLEMEIECHAPPNAMCRMHFDCDCEMYLDIGVTENGVPCHRGDCGSLHMGEFRENWCAYVEEFDWQPVGINGQVAVPVEIKLLEWTDGYGYYMRPGAVVIEDE